MLRDAEDTWNGCSSLCAGAASIRGFEPASRRSVPAVRGRVKSEHQSDGVWFALAFECQFRGLMLVAPPHAPRVSKTLGQAVTWHDGCLYLSVKLASPARRRA